MRIAPDIIRRTYLRKFAVLTVVALVAVAGAGFVLQSNVDQELRHDVNNQMQSSVMQSADTLSKWLDSQKQTTRFLSELAAERNGSEVQSLLSAESKRLPASVDAVHYVDVDSKEVLASTTAGAAGKQLDYLTWENTESETGPAGLQTAPTDGAIVSKSFMHNGAQRIAFASKVPGTNEAVVVSYNAIEAGIMLRGSDGHSSFVVDSTGGNVHLAADSSLIGDPYQKGKDSYAVNAGGAGSVGVHETKSTGNVMAYAPVSGTDWVVVETRPTESAYALSDTVTQGFLILTGIALGGFLLVGATMGRTTARTLRRLRDRATALANGETDDVAGGETGRIDEVGQVQTAFGDVASYLSTASAQADAVANNDFDADVLDEDVPGRLGASLASMRADLSSLIAEMEETNETLQRDAESFDRAMQRAADGDLTVRMGGADHETMTDVADAFDEMLTELEATVGHVDRVAEEVAEASVEAEQGVAEVERAGEEVASSTEEISAGAGSQSERLTEVNNEMSELSAAVEEVAATADEVASLSESAAETGVEGEELADQALDEMSEIEDAAVDTVETVDSLDSQIAEIGEIVDLIDGIAEQTNTLALNASIEAARAGAEGDGFAVVAEEVKSLATETREATQRIADLIERVEASSDEAVDDIEGMRSRIEDGAETVETGLGALSNVVERVEEANDGVQSISTAADDQAASTEEVVTMTEEVATVSEETASEAQTVSAAAEEQAASLSQVSEEVDRVARRAGALRELTRQFEADAAGADDIDDLVDGDIDGGADVPDGTGETAFDFDGDTSAAATDGGADDRGR
ncbi:methyl-accepting chemotaxis protein [Halobaculum sp. P14]|uniref:methyl-accepting chemotaxis protein n=1 Tax=Halobaculum sp. P14 TaxID=3421638 RepID=UPI003EB93BAE